MKDIESAKILFLDSNKENRLSTRLGSNCHFFEKIVLEDDIIQLRLDWNDIDENGYPTLDADFYNTLTGNKKKIKGMRGRAHHSKAIKNKGRSYEWIFRKYKIKFKVVITFSVNPNENICFADSCEVEVIKSNKDSGKLKTLTKALKLAEKTDARSLLCIFQPLMLNVVCL